MQQQRTSSPYCIMPDAEPEPEPGTRSVRDSKHLHAEAKSFSKRPKTKRKLHTDTENLKATSNLQLATINVQCRGFPRKKKKQNKTSCIHSLEETVATLWPYIKCIIKSVCLIKAKQFPYVAEIESQSKNSVNFEYL